MAQFALRWILMFDAVTVAIPGAKNAAQAQANGRAADLPPLSESQMTELKAIYDQDILPHGPTTSTCARPTRRCARSTAPALSTTRSTTNRARRASAIIGTSRVARTSISVSANWRRGSLMPSANNGYPLHTRSTAGRGGLPPTIDLYGAGHRWQLPVGPACGRGAPLPVNVAD